MKSDFDPADHAPDGPCGVPDGGPAFPQGAVRDCLGDVHAMFGGMTLRDWFAGMALCGYMSDPEIPAAEKAAETCYRIADAMIAAREK